MTALPTDDADAFPSAGGVTRSEIDAVYQLVRELREELVTKHRRIESLVTDLALERKVLADNRVRMDTIVRLEANMELRLNDQINTRCWKCGSLPSIADNS